MSPTRAFIVRPFGRKLDAEGREIDFDRVEAELIDPVLTQLEIGGRTTGEISHQGNIREDMFRLLITADLVIADVSIHNANVFYELGIRHGLQPRGTFLIRADGSRDAYPFDLQTDRYFLYDAANPAGRRDQLVLALRSTLAADPTSKDSPVFQLLPKLTAHDRSVLLPVPADFQEEVERARIGNQRGDLRLLADEVQDFEWAAEGLRLVGEAQFKLKAFPGALETFETLRRAMPDDLRVNLRLATIYQKLATDAPDGKAEYLTRSDQAIARALAIAVEPKDRAEAYSLRASNAKTRWVDDWNAASAAARGAAALTSPYLGQSLEAYIRAFGEDLDAYYPGVNALAMLKLQAGLARATADAWNAAFEDDAAAAAALAERETCAERIAAALTLRLGVDAVFGSRHEDTPDAWAAITRADVCFLTGTKPRRVEAEYRNALAGLDPFSVTSTRRNIELFEALGLHSENVRAALPVIDQQLARMADVKISDQPVRVVLFTGHMIDTDKRAKESARFPRTPQAEAIARRLIEEAVRAEMGEDGGVSLGFAGGACGGDILFHEVCEALGVRTRLFLALPMEQFQVASVQHGGPGWVERYRRLCGLVTPRLLQDSETLPRWLVDKPNYSVWQRNNLWMMFNALALGARHLTLLALYNRELEPDGPGGTADLVRVAQRWGFKTIILDARALLAG